MSSANQYILKNKKILIILTGSLGDVARGLVLAANLKRSESQLEISWLIEEKWYDFARLCVAVDRWIIFKRSQGLSGFIAAIKECRQHNFDYCFDLQRIFKSGIFSLLSGAKSRFGFAKADAKEFNYLFNNHHIPERGEEISKQLHYFEFLKLLGLKDISFAPYLSALKLSDLNQKLANLVPVNSIAVILGSSWESKDWPEKNYVEAIERILSKSSYSLILIGDRSKVSLGSRLEAQFSNTKRVVNLAGSTKLSEMAAVLAECAIAFGPDSGPAHVAAATGTSFVTLFGPTRIQRTAPWGCEKLALQVSVPCGPCYKRQCPGYGGVCMSSITADMLVERVFSELAAGKKTNFI